MKLSWSYRIVILYAGFMALIITMVTICMKQTVELESKDYYAQELKYQDKIDAMHNAGSLKTSIEHEVTNKQIVLSIPTEMIGKDFVGEVYFFCPANSAKDFKTKMQFDSNGKQVINKNVLQSGCYKMKLSWQNDGKSYFKESIITIK